MRTWCGAGPSGNDVFSPSSCGTSFPAWTFKCRIACHSLVDPKRSNEVKWGHSRSFEGHFRTARTYNIIKTILKSQFGQPRPFPPSKIQKKIIPTIPGQKLDKTHFRAKLALEPYQYHTRTSLGYFPDTPYSILGPFQNPPGVKSFRAPKPIKWPAWWPLDDGNHNWNHHKEHTFI